MFSQDPEWFTKERITHVLSVYDGANPLSPVMQRTMKHLHIKIDDAPHEKLSKDFSNIVRFIHGGRSAGGIVYVHCAAGISRSSTSLCSYVMAWLDCSMEQGLALIRAGRSIISPNEGFLAQLRQWEASAERKQLRDELRDPKKYQQSALLERDQALFETIMINNSVTGHADNNEHWSTYDDTNDKSTSTEQEIEASHVCSSQCNCQWNTPSAVVAHKDRCRSNEKNSNTDNKAAAVTVGGHGDGNDEDDEKGLG